MKSFRSKRLLALLVSVFSVSTGLSIADEGAARAVPEITISKATTFVTRPLNKDGTVDFASAINRYYSRGVNAQNNANVLFWQAIGPHPENATMSPEFYRLMGMRSPAERGVYLQHLHGFLERRFGNNIPAAQRDLIFEHQGLAQTRPWRDEEYPEVAAWLAANEIPLRLMVAGSRRNHYFSPMVVSDGKKKTFGLMNVLLPGVQGSRVVARMLTARAMRHIKAGNADAAWDDLIACHRIGRLVGRGPTLVEGLVGYSIGGIASEATATFLAECRMTANQLVRYRREFDALPPIPQMGEKVNLCERIMFLESVTLLAYGGPDAFQRLFGFGGAGAAGPKPPKTDFARIDWDALLKTGNRWYDRLYAAMSKRDRAARKAALRDVEDEIRNLAMQAKNAGKPQNPREAGEQIGRILISHFAPSLTAARMAEDRYRQRSRLVRVGLALAAYRLDQGRYPQRLAQLTPKHISSIPNDLFAGNALNYQRNKTGYLLYSVGPNEKDDGGMTLGDGDETDDLRIVIPRPEEN